MLTTNVLSVTSTTAGSDALNVLWNIESPACFRGNENLISFSVPVYEPSMDFNLESVNVTKPTPPPPVEVKLYWNTFVVTAVFTGGVNLSSISPPDVDEYPTPTVPIPVKVVELVEKLSIYPNSVK